MVGVLAIVGSCAACGGPTPGQPIAAATPNGDASAADPSTPNSTARLPVDQPCGLLPASALRQLDAVGSPKQEMVGTAHACELNTSDYNIIVGIRDNVGLGGFQSTGGKVVDTTIGRHPAKEELDSPTCTIGISVSASARVDVMVTSIMTADPCSGAMQVAQLVEPNLP